MHSPTCVSVVVCVVRKPRPCLSYSRRRDRTNLILLHGYYKGGGTYGEAVKNTSIIAYCHTAIAAYACQGVRMRSAC